MGAKTVNLTPTLDTSAYIDGDVLFVTKALLDVVQNNSGAALLQSLIVIDADDQKQALDLLFFDSDVTIGTINATPSITDAAALSLLGRVSVATTDYYDLGGVSVAGLRSVGLIVRAAENTRNVYVAGVSRGTGTYTASGLRFRFGLVY